MPDDTQVQQPPADGLKDAERSWIEALAGSAVRDTAREAREKLRGEILEDIYNDVDYLTDDMRDAFTFDVIRKTPGWFGRTNKEKLHSISEVNRDVDSREVEDELDVFHDLRKALADDAPDAELDDRMDETTRRLRIIAERGDDFSLADDADKTRDPLEVLDRIEANLKKVKSLVARMETTLDDNGERVFTDADIREEVFMPMVREGIFPESMIPDRFSEVAATFSGASEAYMERLVTYSKENPDGDRMHNVKVAGDICKQAAQIALSSTEIVAACGGSAQAVKTAKFAKLAVSFTADAAYQAVGPKDADKVLDGFRKAIVGGVNAFGDKATATLVGGILTGAIAASRSARAAIQAGDPAAMLDEMANCAVGICASVASQKSEDEAEAINGIATIVQKSVKAGTATLVRPAMALRDGKTPKDAALEALNAAMTAAATEIASQCCAAVHDTYIKDAKEEAEEKARKEGKDPDKAGKKAVKDGEKDKDAAVDAVEDGVPELIGNTESLIMGLAEDVNGIATADERHMALVDVLNQKAMNATKAADDLKAGAITAEAIEMARLILDREPEKPSARLVKARAALADFLKGPKIDDKSRGEVVRQHLQSLNLDADAALADLNPQDATTPPRETHGSLALADFVLGAAMVAEAKDKVDAFMGGDGDADKAKKAMETLQGVMAEVQLRAAQEALEEEGRAFRQAMELGFDMPTDPEDLAEQEAQRQLTKIEPLIRQIKQDRELIELASSLVNGGLTVLEQFLPPAGIATAGVAMIEELHKAAQRQQEFLLWLDNVKDAKGAASIHLEGFLNRMNLSDRQRIEHGIQAALKCAEMIGKILETAGAAHPAVLAAGKVVSASAAGAGAAFEIAKTVRTEVEMRIAWNTYQQALVNPRSRKLARQAIRKNPTLAKYAIAYGATVDNNLIARQAMMRCGLNAKVLQDEDTNVAKVVEYLEALYPEDPVLERQVPTEAWFPSGFAADPSVWVAFVKAAQTKAEPPMAKARHAEVTALFVAFDKDRKAFAAVDPNDVAGLKDALEGLVSRTGELRTRLEALDPRDGEKQPHVTMRSAAIGFIQAVAELETRYRGDLDGLDI